jgi:hypothetical protein
MDRNQETGTIRRAGADIPFPRPRHP